jgi:hypothetical protein
MAMTRPQIAGLAVMFLGLALLTAAIVVLATAPQIYRAVARLAVEAPPVASSPSAPVLPGLEPDPREAEARRLVSRTVLLTVASNLNLFAKWHSRDGATLSLDEMHLKAGRAVRVRLPRGSALMELEASRPDAAEAAALANEIAAVFLRQRRDSAPGPSPRLAAIQQDLDKLRQEFTAAGDKVEQAGKTLEAAEARAAQSGKVSIEEMQVRDQLALARETREKLRQLQTRLEGELQREQHREAARSPAGLRLIDQAEVPESATAGRSSLALALFALAVLAEAGGFWLTRLKPRLRPPSHGHPLPLHRPRA